MSNINAITYVVIDSLVNSPYKGYYKKEYLSILDRLFKMGTVYFEDWMVDEFVSEIVGGAEVLLKRFPKLGKSKKCAVSMLEHYIFWTYEIGNTEEGDKLKKSFEEVTGVKYNAKKVTDIIHFNTSSKELPVDSNKSVVITVTPPKNKFVEFEVKGIVYPRLIDVKKNTFKEELIENPKRTPLKGSSWKWMVIFIVLFLIINYTEILDMIEVDKNIPVFLKHTLVEKSKKYIYEAKDIAIPVMNEAIKRANNVFNRLY